MNFKIFHNGFVSGVSLFVCSAFTTPVAAAYDIDVHQFANPSTAINGEVVTFNISLTNNGPDASERGDLVFKTSGIAQWSGPLEWTASDNVPEDIRMGWSQAMGDQTLHFYDLPPLAASESILIQVMMRPYYGGTLETTAQFIPSVDAETEDTNPANNQAVITTSITEIGFDLGVTCNTSTDYVQHGSLIVTDYVITNHGPDDCPDVHFTIGKSPYVGPDNDIRWNDFELLSIVDAPSWTFEEDTVFMFGTEEPVMAGRYSNSLAASESTTVTVLYLVHGDGEYDVAFHRYAIVGSSIGHDYNNANDRAFLEIPYADVVTGTDLQIESEVPEVVGLNEPFTYTVKAFNRGPNSTSRAYIGNLLPESFEVLAVRSDKGTAVAVDKYVKLENANLGVGEAATLEVTVTPNFPGEVALVSGVVSDHFDSNLGNNHIANLTRITIEGPPIVGPEPCVNAPDLVAKLTKVKRVGRFKKKQNEWEFTVTAQAQIRNIGTATAPKSPVWFYLSADTVLDPSDLLIGGKNVNSIKPGKQRSTKLKAKLPAGVNPVGLYVIAVADGENIVAECNETNNWSAIH